MGEITGTLRNAERMPFRDGCLRGNVYGHVRFGDGAVITTSTVVEDLPDDCFRTRNSVYKVESWGEPVELPDRLPTGRSFRLKVQAFDHEPGTICYEASGYDYGLARDDTQATGIPHVSMTLNPDGSYPTFTVAIRDLEAAS